MCDISQQSFVISWESFRHKMHMNCLPLVS